MCSLVPMISASEITLLAALSMVRTAWVIGVVGVSGWDKF